MSAADRADAVAEVYSQLLRVPVSAVAEHDRVTTDLVVIPGGWQIVAEGHVIARVEADGKVKALWSLHSVSDLEVGIDRGAA